MQAVQTVACDARCPGLACQQSDAEPNYVQAWLDDIDTWGKLPIEVCPGYWFGIKHGAPLYKLPVVRLLHACYGHPGTGTGWVQHCDAAVRNNGFQTIDTWPTSCYDHKEWASIRAVSVGDLTTNAPGKHTRKAWATLQEHI